MERVETILEVKPSDSPNPWSDGNYIKEQTYWPTFTQTEYKGADFGPAKRLLP
jgi:hypothetical protein